MEKPILVALLLILCIPIAVAIGDNETIKVIVEFKSASQQVGSLKFNSERAQLTKDFKAANNYDMIINHEYKLLLNGVSTTIKKKDLEATKAMPNVKNVWVDEMVYITSEIPANVNLIKAPQVWAKKDETGANITGKNIKVAIIDTGIAYDHPDIANCTITQYLTENCSRVVYGYDYHNNDNDPYDDNGHGTHCAGVVGANGQIKGVAPDVIFFAYKVLGHTGSGYTSNVIAAIENATSMGADIISMSLGAPGYADGEPMKTVIDNAVASGVIVVSAVGNSGPGYGTVSIPGAIISGIGVGAVDNTNKIAAFSSRGFVYNKNGSIAGIKPDVVAPGVSIKSTVPIGNCSLCSPTGYKEVSGTSMATPHVAGLAALIKQAHPEWTTEQIKAAIMNPATNLNYDSNTQGNGMIDAIHSYDTQNTFSPTSAYLGLDSLGKKQIWSSQKTFKLTGEYVISIISDLPAKILQNGESIILTVTVNNSLVSNGTKYGRLIATGVDSISVPFAFVVQVNNTPPVLSNPRINNDAPKVTDKIICNPGNYYDADDDPEEITNRQWMWYKNGFSMGIITQDVLVGYTPETNSGWCYQETSTEGTPCGGLSNGAYACNGGWHSSYPCSNTYDGNWSTKGMTPFIPGTVGYLYINYTRPGSASNISKWRVSEGTTATVVDLNIDINCFQQQPLQFMVATNYSKTPSPTGYYSTSWSCWNGTKWIILRKNDFTINIFEEAILWYKPIGVGLDAIEADNISCRERTSDGQDYSNYAFSNLVSVVGNFEPEPECDYYLGNIATLPQITSTRTIQTDPATGHLTYLWGSYIIEDETSGLTQMTSVIYPNPAVTRQFNNPGQARYTAVITYAELGWDTATHQWITTSSGIDKQVDKTYNICGVPAPDAAFLNNLMNIIKNIICQAFPIFGLCQV